jgi:ATP-dependent DNA helicase RecG
MSLTLSSKISEIAGVGDSYVKRLEKLGITTVQDLFLYFPRKWDDFSKIVPIADLKVGETSSICGSIWSITTTYKRRRMAVTEAIISDESGSLKVVWFNQAFLSKSLEKGDKLYISGKLEWSSGGVSMLGPSFEKVPDGDEKSALKHTGRIIPVYPETEGVTSKWLRGKISDLAKLVYGIPDHLPREIKEKYGLIEYSAAIRAMHYPENLAELKRAHDRMIFDDLFCLMCAVLSNRKEISTLKALSVDYNESLGSKFVQGLPYELTNAQRKVAWQILKDIGKPLPMNRLLEGDVGSGKTVIAVMAALMVAAAGYQVAIIAPTEILARQHYDNFQKILEGFGVRVGLLTGSVKGGEKAKILKEIEDNEVQIIIGTHSLISPEVKFWTLALVIVDEQHRFGVKQRMALKKSNGADAPVPHFLSMSATPIPRTLAVTVFGDLDLSIIDEMPPGRKKVSTFLVPPEKKADSYDFIRKEIQEDKRQVFIICPLVEKSEKIEVKSATDEYHRLKTEIFPDLRIGLTHGKLKDEDKTKVMGDFMNKKLDILVATSVVEVGVDVPNASVIVIEGADRFGLAQLHQFRGRVGRGDHKSYCLLFTDSQKSETLDRLSALISSRDGFKLAEKDLDLRGPGELIGLKQHGKVDNALLAAMKDHKLIERTRQAAADFLGSDELENYPLLKNKVKDFGIVATLE